MMTGKEKHLLLSAIKRVEAEFGTLQAAWGFRKHLAILGARKKASKRIALLRREILQLERSAK